MCSRWHTLGLPLGQPWAHVGTHIGHRWAVIGQSMYDRSDWVTGLARTLVYEEAGFNLCHTASVVIFNWVISQLFIYLSCSFSVFMNFSSFMSQLPQRLYPNIDLYCIYNKHAVGIDDVCYFWYGLCETALSYLMIG